MPAKEVDMNNKWYYFSGLMPLVVIAFIFALPLKTVDIQKTETYWDVEMRNEPYTTTEAYTDTEPYTTTETYTKTVQDPWVYSPYYNNNYSPYYSPYYSGCYSCGGIGCSSCPSPYWPHSGNTTAYHPYPYWQSYYNPYYYQQRTVTDTREVVKYRTVTKYREVTRFREVPTKVLKERIVTEHIRVSIWQYLFM